MRDNRLDVTVGGQYGSESKGRVTAEIAKVRKQQGRMNIGVRVAGPNAGHVVIDAKGSRFALRQIPVAMVVDPMCIGIIAAGSEIDYQVLADEIGNLERGGHHIRHRLLIDQQATVLSAQHRQAEGGNDGEIQNRIGSTGKGIGAARSDRIWRKAATVGQQGDGIWGQFGSVIDTQAYLHGALDSNAGYAVGIEGTQGYGLGLHAGHYPYCTSSDCRAIDFLAMAGISPWGYEPTTLFNVHVVLRAYPIRVAGNSGPMLGETSWDDLGLPEEHTTVTHKVRRVGAWDAELARAAVQANGGEMCQIHLAMADQVFPELAGTTELDDLGMNDEILGWIDQIERDCGARVHSVGTGPASTIWRPVHLEAMQATVHEHVRIVTTTFDGTVVSEVTT